MGNVANLELSRELYELSGWNDKGMDWWLVPFNEFGEEVAPKYNLGFLLRKMPPPAITRHFRFRHMRGGTLWSFQYLQYRFTADTPEDAVAKLCIELFKQNILTKES